MVARADEILERSSVDVGIGRDGTGHLPTLTAAAGGPGRPRRPGSERADMPVVTHRCASCCSTWALGRTVRSRSMIPNEMS